MTTYEPELMEKDGEVYYLSDDGEGHMVAWSSCHGSSGGCGLPIMRCNCKSGPVEPYYITRWRVEAQGDVWSPPKRGNLRSERPLGTRNVESPPTNFSDNRSLSMADFIDDTVIAAAKAASEEGRPA